MKRALGARGSPSGAAETPPIVAYMSSFAPSSNEAKFSFRFRDRSGHLANVIDALRIPMRGGSGVNSRTLLIVAQ